MRTGAVWFSTLPGLQGTHHTPTQSVFCQFLPFYSIFPFLYSDTWLTYLTDLLSQRLIGAVGARINVRSSYSQWWPAANWIQTEVLAVASPALLPLSYPDIPYHQQNLSKRKLICFIWQLSIYSSNLLFDWTTGSLLTCTLTWSTVTDYYRDQVQLVDLLSILLFSVNFFFF